jgi:peptidoglycan glycosyltransferase
MLLGAGVLLAFSWWPRSTRSLPIFNRTVLRWATIILVCFALVSVQLVRVQVVESARTVNRIGESPDGEVVSNPRQRARSLDVQRGRILDEHGNVLADSTQLEDGTWARTYPTTAAAGLIGYYSPGLFGSTNIEQEYDDYLSGVKGGNPAEDWLNGVLHKDQRGYDLGLTLDLDLQQQADDLLAGRPGAVILMDADTGAVLAMAGAPSFDPNKLYANVGQQTQQQIDEIQQYWADLNAEDGSPLIFRPTQGVYNPGSTFKTVTASALIDTGKADLNTVYRDEGIFEVDGRVIEEANRPDPTQVNFTLEQSFAYSLNVVFAQIGLQLGSDTLWEYANRFGIGRQIDFDIPTSDQTQIASSRDALNNRALLADTGFGQGEILVSPLDMALVVSTIANDGVQAHPYVVDRVMDHNGKVLDTFDHGDDTRIIAPESAAMVQDLMRATATYGAAKGMDIEGATVGGKTGTAEVGSGDPHSWFIGYAKTDQHSYAVAVVVEHGGAGSQVAMPIGADMLRSAVQGQP